MTESDDFHRKHKDLEALAQLLDSRFSLFGVKFGLDSLIGLIPGIGDLATGSIGLYLISKAALEGAGFFTIIRMIFNWLLDLLLGSIPGLGDIFDVAFRSNSMNVRLLQRHLEKKALQISDAPAPDQD